MKIIRDQELGGLMMIPLFFDWNIKRCNQVGCRNKPTTIIANTGPGVPVFGLCEKDFQRGNKDDGGAQFQLEWDDYDAFTEPRTHPDGAKRA